MTEEVDFQEDRVGLVGNENVRLSKGGEYRLDVAPVFVQGLRPDDDVVEIDVTKPM